MPSYSWKSIWEARGLLQEGLGWRVGSRINILIFEHAWIPGSVDYRLYDNMQNDNVPLVAKLIDSNSRKWKQEVILNTFYARDMSRILQIPLEKEKHDDLVVWHGEPSGEISIRSSYKLLQVGNFSPNFNEL